MSLTQVTYAGVPCYQYVDDSLDLTKPVNVMLQLPGEGESVAPITLLSKYLATGTLTATSKKGMVIIEGQPGVSWGLDVAQLQAFISAIQAAFKVNALALAGYSIGDSNGRIGLKVPKLTLHKYRLFIMLVPTRKMRLLMAQPYLTRLYMLNTRCEMCGPAGQTTLGSIVPN